MSEEVKDTRSLQQNKRLHQWCRELANEFNDRGLYLQKVLKPTWDVLWTEELVKDNIVRPIAETIAKTNHTSQLSKREIQQVIDTIDKNLLTKFDIDMPFSDEE